MDTDKSTIERLRQHSQQLSQLLLETRLHPLDYANALNTLVELHKVIRRLTIDYRYRTKAAKADTLYRND